jgi:hypothetical protein
MLGGALTAEFDQAMFSIYQRALLEANYKATRFLHMLHEHGGLQTAIILIRSPNISEGYAALWERRRLDLTVEAVIYDNPKWHQLFDKNDLAICAKRLKAYDYPGA